MRFQSVRQLVDMRADLVKAGPVAIIVAEDETELDATIRHHFGLGFRSVIVLSALDLALPGPLAERAAVVALESGAENGAFDAINALIAAGPGSWFYYGYNAEFLFFPFCESRTIGELLAFHTEERRDAVLAYTVDLYAGDLDEATNAVSLTDAYLDQSGYYALARQDEHNHPKDRQLDFFGGLKWRFEEHVPEARRRIDRIALFRAKPGLRLLPDHRLSDEEYNTYACPWHNNITVAVASFRTAKALRANSGSAFDIQTFRWHNSLPFDWHSQQLLDLGLMEPGQWF